jgi:hypothetical protein
MPVTNLKAGHGTGPRGAFRDAACLALGRSLPDHTASGSSGVPRWLASARVNRNGSDRLGWVRRGGAPPRLAQPFAAWPAVGPAAGGSLLVAASIMIFGAAGCGSSNPSAAASSTTSGQATSSPTRLVGAFKVVFDVTSSDAPFLCPPGTPPSVVCGQASGGAFDPHYGAMNIARTTLHFTTAAGPAGCVRASTQGSIIVHGDATIQGEAFFKHVCGGQARGRMAPPRARMPVMIAVASGNPLGGEAWPLSMCS